MISLLFTKFVRHQSSKKDDILCITGEDPLGVTIMIIYYCETLKCVTIAEKHVQVLINKNMGHIFVKKKNKKFPKGILVTEGMYKKIIKWVRINSISVSVNTGSLDYPIVELAIFRNNIMLSVANTKTITLYYDVDNVANFTHDPMQKFRFKNNINLISRDDFNRLFSWSLRLQNVKLNFEKKIKQVSI